MALTQKPADRFDGVTLPANLDWKATSMHACQKVLDAIPPPWRLLPTFQKPELRSLHVLENASGIDQNRAYVLESRAIVYHELELPKACLVGQVVDYPGVDILLKIVLYGKVLPTPSYIAIFSSEEE